MILYNPHDPTSFCKIRGSVLPRACVWGALSAILSILLKILDDNDVINVQSWSIFKKNSVYEGFTFVLSFVIVFRASQAYTRYWHAATAVHEMRTQWYEAAANLVCFAQTSTMPKQVVDEFLHVVVRLFTLLHAMAMEEIASLLDEEFPLLDIEGLDGEDLRILTEPAVQGRKVEVVTQWIKTHMIEAMKSKVLTVPAPILTRVFQTLGQGNVKYHEALQVVIWPFPFPYAQISYFLVFCHCLFTPIALAQSMPHMSACAIFTLVSVACVKSIDLTAAELENPFGEDENDLPTMEMHHEMIQDAVLLTNPRTWKVPRLVEGAILDPESLNAVGNEHRLSLYEYQRRKQPRLLRGTGFEMSASMGSLFSSKRTVGTSPSGPYDVDKTTTMKSKWAQQQYWARQLWPKRNTRLAKALRLDDHGARAEPTLQPFDTIAALPQQIPSTMVPKISTDTSATQSTYARFDIADSADLPPEDANPQALSASLAEPAPERTILKEEGMAPLRMCAGIGGSTSREPSPFSATRSRGKRMEETFTHTISETDEFPWQMFLAGLSEQMQQHFKQQEYQIRKMHELYFRTIQEAECSCRIGRVVI